jgi:very-short-patch-repair endonuclease
MKPADEALARIATARGGVADRADVRRAQMSRHQLSRRVRDGRIKALGPDVFQVGPVMTVEGARRAASWLAGSRGGMSFFSAADVFGAWDRDLGGVHHITVPRGCGPSSGGMIEVHHARTMELTTHRGWRVTTPVRTLLDLATVVSASELTDVLAAMHHRRLLPATAFEGLTARYDGHHGLAAVLALVRSETESPLEDRVASEILAGLALPEPAAPQQWLTGLSGNRYRADFLCREAGVAIEADSRSFHARLLAFDDDRTRDADLAAVGVLTFRITAAHLSGQREATRARLLATVQGRRWQRGVAESAT